MLDGKIQRQLYLKLHQEFRILHLIYHRNKNQHHVAIWWKRFNILKRNCAQVVEILQTKKIIPKPKLVKLYNLIHKLTKIQLSQMYYDFNGVIALGQFVTLGVVLVGLLGRIIVTYKNISELYEPLFKEIGCVASKVSQLKCKSSQHKDEQVLEIIADEELGEIIDELILQKPNKTLINMNFDSIGIPFQKDTKKKEKKKKFKSTIDDIFG